MDDVPIPDLSRVATVQVINPTPPPPLPPAPVYQAPVVIPAEPTKSGLAQGSNLSAAIYFFTAKVFLKFQTSGPIITRIKIP